MTSHDPADNKIFVPVATDLATKPGFNLVGYDDDMRRITEILMQSDANNVLLVGSAGAGSSLILGIEQRRQQANISLDILSKHVVRLDLPNLLLGKDNEEREHKFRDELDNFNAKGNVIVVLPDLTSFLNTLNREGMGSLLNIFLGKVRRSRMQAIAVIESKQRNKLLEEHPELKDFFTIHEVKETSPEQTLHALRGMRMYYEGMHGVQITDEALQTVADLSRKYKGIINDQLAQPNVSFVLLDRALSRFRVNKSSKPTELNRLEEEVAELNNEKAALQNQTTDADSKGRLQEIETRLVKLKPDFDKQQKQWASETTKIRDLLTSQARQESTVAEADRQIERLEPLDDPDSSAMLTQQRELRALAAKELIKVNNLLNDGQKSQKHVLGRQDVFDAFGAIYGIPTEQLNENEREKILKMEQTLNDRVFGQEQAVKQVSNVMRVARSGLGDEGKPEGSFLFLGPSGVGKTELGKGLAEFRTGDPNNMVRLDMSEFMEKHSVAKLIGAPPGYAGHDEGGILTNNVLKKPKAVVLFDEIEKAHPDVFDVLLQVLDDGRLTDGRGVLVKFDETLIVATSNIGSQYFLDPNLTFEQAETKARADLYQRFRPEFLNRFTGIVGFNRLAVGALFKVAQREVTKINKNLAHNGLRLSVSDQEIHDISEAVYDPTKNARAMTNYVTTVIKPALATFVLQANGHNKKDSRVITMAFKGLHEDPVFEIMPDVVAHEQLSPKGNLATAHA